MHKMKEAAELADHRAKEEMEKLDSLKHHGGGGSSHHVESHHGDSHHSSSHTTTVTSVSLSLSYD